MAVLDFIVHVFSDIIFLNIFGFAINPIYRSIERSANTAIANSFLIIVEIIFYSLVLTGCILLIEKIAKNRKASRKDKRIDSETKKEFKDNKRNQ